MFRTLAILLLVALFGGGCASQGGYPRPETYDCSASGNELSLDLALNLPKVMMEQTTDNLTLIVVLGNNSGRTLEVKSIRAEPGRTAQHRYALEESFQIVDHVLAPGEEGKFELPMRGTARQREQLRTLNDSIELTMTIRLTDDTSYRCNYFVEAPR